VPLSRLHELALLPDLPPLLARILALPTGAAPLFARSVIPPAGGAWEIHFIG
jgi:hypothetical protein